MSNESLDAAMSAGAQVGSAIITNEGNKKSQKRAEKANLAFWEKQNEYNDPSQQMARLRKAGLNPNLIYGSNASGASGNAESIAPAKASEYNMENPLRDINQFADHRQKEATTDNLRVQNTNLMAETALRGAQTVETQNRAKLTGTQARLANATFFNSLEASNEALRLQKINTISADLDRDFKDQSIKNRLEDIAIRVQISKQQLTGEELKNSLLRYEKELNSMNLTKGDPWHYRLMGEPIQQINKGIDDFKNLDLPKAKKWFNKTFPNNMLNKPKN